MFEDALVVRDREAVVELFVEGGVLVTGEWLPAARGADQIARLAEALWQGDRAYVADPLRVLQARGTALVLGERSVSVARRGADGAWRYAISLLSFDPTTH